MKSFTKATADCIPEQQKRRVAGKAEKPRPDFDFGTEWWTRTWRKRLRFFFFGLMSIRDRH